MNDIRCGACGRKLAEGSFIELRIKCNRCKTMNFLSVSNAKPEHRECQTKVDTHEHIQERKH